MSGPHRLIIWGPGDMGGRALRTALESPDFDVVGVKVFSPHKNGKDIGELDAIRPIHEQEPGRARRDLSITGLLLDDRLSV
ncbi:hypothetical protein [Nocardia sp. NPDC005745]|uniref:hypothetical protein n=1 Tax=Nocardia sp. NPDC005745 TaxID=3157061 RepID=UPI0033D089FC